MESLQNRRPASYVVVRLRLSDVVPCSSRGILLEEAKCKAICLSPPHDTGNILITSGNTSYLSGWVVGGLARLTDTDKGNAVELTN